METDELKRLLRQPEGDDLEFKSAVPRPDTLATHISAFANTAGGRIVIGAREDGTIAGVDNMDRAQTRIVQAVTAVSPSIEVQSETVNIDDKSVLILTVPRGERSLYLASGRAVRRSGSTIAPMDSEALYSRIVDRAASPEDLRAKIADLTETVQVLNDELIAARSWKRKLPDMVIGGVVGAAISLGITLAIGL